MVNAVLNRSVTIALAGNPNAGKTTLFNFLTGLKQKVANYPGVTVERKEGVWNLADGAVHVIDLPGLYSLDATSLDEQIASEIIRGELASARPEADLVLEPLKTRLSRFSLRRWLIFCSPITHRMLSIILLFPQPFGPITPVMPSSK